MPWMCKKLYDWDKCWRQSQWCRLKCWMRTWRQGFLNWHCNIWGWIILSCLGWRAMVMYCWIWAAPLTSTCKMPTAHFLSCNHFGVFRPCLISSGRRGTQLRTTNVGKNRIGDSSWTFDLRSWVHGAVICYKGIFASFVPAVSHHLEPCLPIVGAQWAVVKWMIDWMEESTGGHNSFCLFFYFVCVLGAENNFTLEQSKFEISQMSQCKYWLSS